MKHKWGTNKQLIRGYTFDAGMIFGILSCLVRMIPFQRFLYKLLGNLSKSQVSNPLQYFEARNAFYITADISISCERIPNFGSYRFIQASNL